MYTTIAREEVNVLSKDSSLCCNVGVQLALSLNALNAIMMTVPFLHCIRLFHYYPKVSECLNLKFRCFRLFCCIPIKNYILVNIFSWMHLKLRDFMFGANEPIFDVKWNGIQMNIHCMKTEWVKSFWGNATTSTHKCAFLIIIISFHIISIIKIFSEMKS